MKAETIKKRMEKAGWFTKAGAVRSNRERALWVVTYPDYVRWHFTFWDRKGRTLRDYLTDVVIGLREIGIDFRTGNDAPRGGREGDYIELTQKGRRQVREFANSKK